MNTSAEITLPFGDGLYSFALKLKQIEELERKEPLQTLFRRIVGGAASALDVAAVIRLGLIGGGTPAGRAQQLVSLYVDGQPLAAPGDPASPLATAQAILAAAWEGVPELVESSPPGELPAASSLAGSMSPPSEARAPTGDGPLNRSAP